MPFGTKVTSAIKFSFLSFRYQAVEIFCLISCSIPVGVVVVVVVGVGVVVVGVGVVGFGWSTEKGFVRPLHSLKFILQRTGPAIDSNMKKPSC